jgi:hypothetical protein
LLPFNLLIPREPLATHTFLLLLGLLSLETLTPTYQRLHHPRFAAPPATLVLCEKKRTSVAASPLLAHASLRAAQSRRITGLPHYPS